MKTNKLFNLLFALCLLFAVYSYYQLVVNPASSHSIKCEGLILDQTRKYHLSDKNSLSELAVIRPEINVNPKDIILHYRDQDIEKVTPSYWGSLYYDGVWKFKLDKSFSSQPNTRGNFHLPFMRFAEKQHHSIRFIKPNEVLSERQLNEKLFFNYPFGDRASRFYLQILNLKGFKILSFFDEGIKKTYRLNNRNNDTIGVTFGKDAASTPSRLFNYSFTNSSSLDGGNYEIIHNYKENNTTVKNLITGDEIAVSSATFRVGDILFSIKNNYNFYEKLLLVVYLFITVISFFFLLGIKSTSVLSKPLKNYRIVLLCFILLGFPVLITAFETQSFSFIRKMVIAVFIASVPVGSVFLGEFLRSLNLRNLRIASKSINCFNKIRKNDFWFGALLILLVGFSLLTLFLASNERVLGIPTLHYVKTIILGFLAISFAPVFQNFFSNISSFVLFKYFRNLTSSILLVIMAVIIAVITKDVSSFLFVVLTVFLLDLFYGRFPIVFPKFKFRAWYFPVLYFCFSLVVLFFYNDIGFRKLYRITFSYASPSSHLYANVHEFDRESVGILFQDVQLIKENPFGVQLNIPVESLSVSHTDFAVHWCLVQNGFPFLLLLFLAIVAFIYTTLFFVRLLTLKQENGQTITRIPEFLKIFVAFMLIMTMLQTLIPFASNLFLPGAILAGVSFPFVSISVFDAIFILIALLILDLAAVKSEDHITSDLQENFTAITTAFSKKWTSFFSIGLFVWVIIKIIVFENQPPQDLYWKKKPNDEAFQIKLADTSSAGIVSLLDSCFCDADMTELSNQEKKIGNFFNHRYYGSLKPLAKENSYFSLPMSYHKKRIAIDSLFVQKSIRVSGPIWNALYPPAFVKRVYINKTENYVHTSEYFSNLNIHSKTLDIDQSALINKLVKEFCSQKLKGYNPVVSVIVTDLEGRIVLNSGFPFQILNPEVVSFFPGSVKKTLLAAYIAEKEKELLKKPVSLSSGNQGSPITDWLRRSDNTATLALFKKIDIDGFSDFLQKQFSMPFYSLFTNGFSEVPLSDFLKSVEEFQLRNVIGGAVRYTAIDINSWGRTLRALAEKNDNLYIMLNSPLTPNGTAYQVSQSLTAHGFDSKKYIAKTGTLEEMGQNIASCFLIASPKYSISVLIDGKQPASSNAASAKNLFVELIPLLKEYLK